MAGLWLVVGHLEGQFKCLGDLVYISVLSPTVSFNSIFAFCDECCVDTHP